MPQKACPSRLRELAPAARGGITLRTIFMPNSVLGGAATLSEGFVISFLKVPLACLGCMAAAVQPSGLGNSRKFVYKTFRTSGRPTQYLSWLVLLQTRLLLFLFAWERIQKSQRPQLLAMVQRLQKYCPNNVLETLRTG